ncbi:hypothetical protein M409DRAFT_71646 [Zasmidium cellare ATCC 36951]|uniref:Peptidase S33 tripeptidyl aminopeptidase-like C-terminal domain-containing protein n=1 Tax=Zasmidium cellare ATCC 36951 TaxID=1080233 RepID=A0A6A6BV83_ZASCE|nr:uncharacterized protein M409DRAFT_71646 [Zasmidium cellare ATCC 36951]KAF2158433.1 hypothetical protein M409DRAFT_71646 [Zasmidium cellare ATCC 36951]
MKRERFRWDTALPLPYLKYQDCYGSGFQCARLDLPMDYWNGTTDGTIGLAVIRRPAAVPVTDSRYGGAVIINPGGPGGSGVEMVLEAGDAIRRVLDDEKGKFFEILGFDPRGVGSTLPSMHCLENSLEDAKWAVRRRHEGLLGSSNETLGRLWSASTAYGQSCSILSEDGSPDIRKYMTTMSVARDMVSIIEAHGEWREQEAARLLRQKRACRTSRNIGQSCTLVPESLRYIRGREKIQYWGFSYGTYLGLTYAAMFPDKVHRLVIDGVMDASDYQSALWYNNLEDAEKVLHQFFQDCARAGHPPCALASETGETTVAYVKTRFTNVMQKLKHSPLPIIRAGCPEVITYSDVKNFIFGALYSPLSGFPLMANLISDIEKGNATLFHDDAVNHFGPAHNQPHNAPPSDVPMCSKSIYGEDSRLGPTIGIACTDGKDQTWLDRPLFEEHLQNVTRMSPFVGPIWAEMRMYCAHYSVRPHQHFAGPWKSETSHPILLIGNTADPVTPLRAARKMSEGFHGAVVLTQDSPGHCSIAAPSECTVQYVKNYFQDGSMPPANTSCEADAVPFDSSLGDAKDIDLDREQLSEDLITLRKTRMRTTIS